jgi:hypothetical protein
MRGSPTWKVLPIARHFTSLKTSILKRQKYFFLSLVLRNSSNTICKSQNLIGYVKGRHVLWHYYEKDKDNDDQRRPMSKISNNLADAPSANKSLPIYTKLALIRAGFTPPLPLP